MRRKVSGLFCFCGFEINFAPLAELAYAPVLETGFSEFNSRVGRQVFAVPAPAILIGVMQVIFNKLDVVICTKESVVPRRGMQPCPHTRWCACPPGSASDTMNCSTSGEVARLSTLIDGFDPRAVLHRGCSSTDRASGLHPEGCGFNSHHLHQFFTEDKPGVDWARS